MVRGRNGGPTRRSCTRRPGARTLGTAARRSTRTRSARARRSLHRVLRARRDPRGALSTQRHRLRPASRRRHGRRVCSTPTIGRRPTSPVRHRSSVRHLEPPDPAAWPTAPRPHSSATGRACSIAGSPRLGGDARAIAPTDDDHALAIVAALVATSARLRRARGAVSSNEPMLVAEVRSVAELAQTAGRSTARCSPKCTPGRAFRVRRGAVATPRSASPTTRRSPTSTPTSPAHGARSRPTTRSPRSAPPVCE